MRLRVSQQSCIYGNLRTWVKKKARTRREYKYGGLGEAFSRIIGRRDEETGEKRRMEGDQEEELGEEEIEIQLKEIKKKKSDRG